MIIVRCLERRDISEIRLDEHHARQRPGFTEGFLESVISVVDRNDVTVVESEPGTTFDDAAAKAVARWRYNPRIDAGVAVERVGVETIIRFALQ